MTDQQVFSGRYEMVRHIARGGMAQVYLARDMLLDRPVALKVLFPELSVDQSFVERFRREAQAAANLSHPNIVSIYDWGQGEHTYFIVMEYVDGQTLSQVIRQSGPLDAGRAAAIGAHVAGALEFAHRRGVIHRDVKPGNVLIDTTGQVKVTDFGIARAVGTAEALTQAGSVMGTATYFSPEQAQGHPVDARSDVYSLGVVLYEMAVGRPPFSGENPLAIAYQHVREEAPLPSRVNPRVPPAFEAIVMKAMAKQPDARYATARQLADDLRRFGSGQAVTAGAPTRAVPVVGQAPTTSLAEATAAYTRAMPATPPAARTPPPGRADDLDGERHGLWVALAVALLAALAVGIFFLGRSQGWWARTPTGTIPTGIAGKPQASALTALNKAGFSDVVSRPQASTSVATGNVVTSSPKPGTRLPVNRRVTLFVSSGPASVTVPSVTGQSQAQAEAALKAAGLVPTLANAASSTVAKGDVITTNPAGGTTVSQGRSVQLVVSTGKPSVKIPDLSGQSPSVAGQTLGNLQLKVTQQTEPSTSVTSGLVTRTAPPAGTMVSAGTAVTVYVSSGAPQVSVPDLSGQTQSQAAQTLSQAGLQAGFVTATVTNPADNAVVVGQSPAANASAPKGSTVQVTIGSYSGPTTTTTPSTTTTTTTTPTSTTTTPGPGAANQGGPGGGPQQPPGRARNQAVPTSG